MKDTFAKRNFLTFMIFLISFILGIFLLVKTFSDQKFAFLKYKEQSNIDYKVYLKDNNFFDEKYIEKGKTYITSLIDYIHVEYDYNIDFDQEVSGEYSYKVIAKIEANKLDNAGTYWEKEYDITDLKTEKVNKKNNIAINQSVDVNYNQYNDILKDFIKSVGLSNAEGTLKVYLQINSNVDGKNISAPIESELVLKLPLSQLAIEASIDSEVENDVHEIREELKKDNVLIFLLATTGGILILLSVASFVTLVKEFKAFASGNEFELQLANILSTYDSIIVNTEHEPEIEGYNVIQVENFNELIDAHSEIRLPINFYRTKDEGIFILYKDKTAWRYTMKKRKRSAKHER